MTQVLFLNLIFIITFLLLLINLIFAPHKPYNEKDSPFECGFHSFMGQNRTQFNISFFVFGLLFLVFDIEIVIIYPVLPTLYNNEILGLIFVLLFFFLLILGFAFELGKNALNINSKQNYSLKFKQINNFIKKIIRAQGDTNLLT